MNELSIEQSVQLAIQKHRAGNLAEAESIYRQLLPLIAGNPQIHFHLGLVLAQQARFTEAAAAFSRALQLKNDFAEAYEALGNVLCNLGRFDDAAVAFARLIQLKPNSAEAHNNLGDALFRIGKLDEALVSCNKAVQLKPDFAEAHNNLGAILHEKGQLDDAIAACRTAIQLNPDYALAHDNLGNLLCKKRQFSAAITSYRRAIEINPDNATVLNDLANAYFKTNDLDAAIENYQHAIRINPQFALAHCSMAQALLMKGDFSNGWREFEWRWHVKPLNAPRPFTQPRWTGGDLHGQTILLYCEQGYGDVFQFIRYAPMVEKKGGRIILEGRRELLRVLQQSGMISHSVVSGNPLPAFDCQCPLVSLPMVLGTNLNSIPADVPYLKADPELANQWRARLGRDNRQKKVGLVWSGSPDHVNDSDRSIPLNQFAPLAAAEGVDFFSLQKGHAGKQFPPTGMQWSDWTDELVDFAGTAALLANLDLVISVDTAVAHLAGAMGKPVWLLLPFSPDWRWMLNRNDTPWYPTMRLFRQPSPGDWESVINRVAQHLYS